MPDKRMRPIVKEEPGAGGAQQQQQHGAAAEGRIGQRRRIQEEAQGGAGLQLQLLMTNADAQAFAVQGMERERAMGEQLLQAKAELAELRAEIRIKEAAIKADLQSRGAALEAELAELRAEIRIKDAAMEAKDRVRSGGEERRAQSGGAIQ
jgi:hypothetical protein